MPRPLPMLRFPAACALLAGALFLASPVCASEAVDSSKAEAAALMQEGRHTDAFERYMRLLRENPDDDEINLNLARSAMGAAKYNQAVMAYERLLEKYPDLAALYAELAHAYMALDDRPSAERALATMRRLDPNIDSASAETLLGDLEKQYDHLQIHGNVRVGLLYDSNANYGPASAAMDLGNWRVSVPDAKARESLGSYLSASLDMAWKPERDSSWRVVGDAQSFVRGNANNELDVNKSRHSEWFRAAVGLRRLSSKTMLDMRLKGEIFDYQWFQNVMAVGPEATFVLALSPSLHLISQANTDMRVYSKDSDRNGPSWSLGQFARFYFGRNDHEFIVGASYNGATANKRDDYSYQGWEASARVLFKLPYAIEVAPFLSFAQSWYQGPATALETENRYDKTWKSGLSLTWRLSEAWAVEAMYQHIDNSSRSNLYEYDQNMLTLGVAWSF